MQEELAGYGSVMAGRAGADVDGGLLAGGAARQTGASGYISPPDPIEGLETGNAQTVENPSVVADHESVTVARASEAQVTVAQAEAPLTEAQVGDPGATTALQVSAGPAPVQPASVQPASARTRRAATLAGVAAALVLALLVGLIATWVVLRHHQAADRARSQAVSAARTYAVDIASYDYHSLDQSFAVVVAHSTPAFAKSYTQSSAALKKVLSKYQATAKAQVVASGVESSSTNHAVVLVFLDQTVTNTVQKTGPTTTHSRVQMSLQRTGGRWAIDSVRLL